MICSPRSRAAALAVAVAIVVSACGKKKVETPAPAPPPPAAATPTTPPPPPRPPAPAPAPAATAPSEDEIFKNMTLDDLNAKGVVADVFFALDSTDLTDQARGTLQQNSDYLKRWPTTKIVIEGHADSRGTNEYNLALGERRATTTRDYMVSLGIPAARITVVSKGEEEPSCREDTEACWQKNRRSHPVFTAK